MAVFVKQKNATYLEWTVKIKINPEEYNYLPMHRTYRSIRTDSNFFMFQDCKCKLEFFTDTKTPDDARLYLKRYGTLIPVIEVTVFATWYSDSEQCWAIPEKQKIRSGYEEIWKHEDCTQFGTSLTFEIYIHDSISKKDECVQTGLYLTADESIQTLSKNFSKLLDLDENYDVEIKCGKHKMKAHKKILSAQSEVFKSMFDSNLMEGQTGIVEIHDTDVCHIKDFVRYLYTGTLPELTFDKAKVLYELGDQYLVKSLMHLCSDYLVDNLSPENACGLLVISYGHSDEKMKNETLAYIINEKIYLQDEIWRPFCYQWRELAKEVHRMLQKRTRTDNKTLMTSKTETPNLNMTVLKRQK